jgi:hypothetical protein
MNNMTDITIDPNKLSSGIPRFYFWEPTSSLPPASSIYNGKQLHEWAEYDAEDDSSYYDCDAFYILEPGRCNPLHHNRVTFHQYLFYETEQAACYTTHISENLVASDNASVCIGIKYHATGNAYNGCFATYKHMSEFWNMCNEAVIKAKTIPHSRPFGFSEPYAYPTEYLDRAVIQNLFEYFLEDERLAHQTFLSDWRK